VHSSKTSAQLLFAAFKKADIRDIIVSPGSRNAPLIIESLAAGYRPEVIVDERSAGFTGLGMAQQTHRPAVLICTSGTAVLNYYPAVAEAFYARIPLIVVSADRPPYRIDKGEGQTIRQDGVLEKHTHYSVTLHLEEAVSENSKLIKEAIEMAFLKQGPVHINIPFEEPLYRQVAEPVKFEPAIRTVEEDRPVSEQTLDEVEKIWKKAGRKLIIVSQLPPGEMLNEQLRRLALFDDVVILTENIGNVKDPLFLEHIDRLIFPFNEHTWQEYAPDLVITIGNNIISKKIKYLLRQQKPAYGHWHIGKTPIQPDTFDVLRYKFDTSPEMFLSQLLFRIYDWQPASEYKVLWHNLAEKRRKAHRKYMKELSFGDMKLFDILADTIHSPYQIQWGNSTVVRYAQLFDFAKGITHYSNRGTSGIDGTVSTAVGAAKRTTDKVLLVTGDLAFRYDSNALWQNFPENLKIIVIYNGGGDIFNFIPGPSTVDRYKEYFVAASLADPDVLKVISGFQPEILRTESVEEARAQIEDFLSNPHSRLLLVNSAAVNNAEILKNYFDFLISE